MNARICWLSGPVLLSLLALSGCNSDKDPAPAPPLAPPVATYTVGGTITGLSGTVVLANNGGDNRSVSADGAFTFATAIAAGSNYSVTIATQPANQTCTLANAAGPIAANVVNVSVTCATYRVTASIGPAGGTLVHPDGAEVIIPAGALTQATDIAISRPAAGWPTPLADGTSASTPVYEITPHGTVFAKPVLIRIPAPAGGPDVFAFSSSYDDGWSQADYALVGNRLELERNTFSWYYAFAAPCAGAPEPYFCIFPSGHAWATGTPAGTIMMTSGAAQLATSTFPSQLGSAGTWTVDGPNLTSVDLHMAYRAAPDCANGHVTLRRIVVGPPHVSQLITDQPASLSAGRGTATISLPRSALSEGLNTFSYKYECTRPNRGPTGGADYITFNVTPAPVAGVTIGGTGTGLSGAGVVIQNGSREILAVLPGSPTFTFTTPQAVGSAYSVRIVSQPQNGNCTIANNVGVANANVTNITLTCTSTQPTYAGLVAVANSASGNFSYYRVSAGDGTLTGPLNQNIGVGGGSFPIAVAIAPNGRYTYVANAGTDLVHMLEIDPAQFYSQNNLGTVTTPNPFALAVDSLSGSFLWVANAGPATISSFSINAANGRLMAVGSGTASGESTPVALAQHPNGNFLYSVNQAGNSISTYEIDRGTGALTRPNPPLTGAVSGPLDMVVSPGGSRAYVLSAGASVVRFAVDPTTGGLTSQGSLVISGASQANALAIHPNGRFLYVTSSSVQGARINVFAIDATTGALTFVTATARGPAGSARIAISRGGTTLYATHRPANTIVTYAIDGSTGVLTELDSDATGSDPEGVAASL